MIKLGDFGLADLIEFFCFKLNRQYGTLRYNAPEVFDAKEVLKSDVWSLGISLIELAQGKNPYDGFSSAKVLMAVCYESIPSLSSSEWSSSFIDFVSKCLVRDVDERASVDELMSVNAYMCV